MIPLYLWFFKNYIWTILNNDFKIINNSENELNSKSEIKKLIINKSFFL